MNWKNWFSRERMNSLKRKAFTLVELIIVITILAILATLAFMSFQWYMKDSRDAVRVSDLTSASKGLTIFFTKSGVYPDTESGITLTASGIPIGYQGFLWQSVARSINMNQVPLDPVDQTRYIYSTSAWKTKFQLMGYTENSNLVSVLPQSYAIDYSERGLAFQWDELGVVLNNDNSLPTINVETASGSSNFKVLFDKTTKTEWSGNLIFSQIYNMRNDLINKKELASLDNSLIGYWDMETTIQSGSTLLLKDWGRYGNHGTCFHNWSEVSCWWSSGWPQIVNENEKTGKSMGFDDRMVHQIKINSLEVNTINNAYTYNFVIKSNNPNKYSSGSSTAHTSCFFDVNYWNWNSLRLCQDTSTPYSSIHNASNTSNLYNINSTWINQFVTVVLNEWKQYYYIDWKIIDTRDVVQVNFSWSAFFGNNGFTNDRQTPWNWTIDEVRIYNRSLSDSEIKALYQTTK